jgi:hypothetical protein
MRPPAIIDEAAHTCRIKNMRAALHNTYCFLADF